MAELKNDTLLRALLKEPVDYTPIWIMRQAGRYLPEYRALRAKVNSFMQFCTNPELATEATLQPLERFPLDAAILFSDILIIPDAMGLGLTFVEGEGPCFARPVRSEHAVDALVAPDPCDTLHYMLDAVVSIRRALNGRVPLIGFAGSPFTLACYMVEGKSSRDFHHIKAMLYSRPDLLHRVLAINARAVTDCLNAQIEAGVQAVQIFDTWGGILSRAAYEEFSLSYIKQIVAGLIKEREGRRVPCIVFTKGGGQWLESIVDTGADAIGLDWMTDMADARHRVGERVALQGNLDPAVLLAGTEAITTEVARILSAYGSRNGHVFNLGHGISPAVDPQQVAVLVEAVHHFSRHCIK